MQVTDSSSESVGRLTSSGATALEPADAAFAPPYDSTDLCAMFDSASLSVASGGGVAQSFVGASSSEAAEIEASGTGGPLIGTCTTGGADVMLSDRFTDEGAERVYQDFARYAITSDLAVGSAKLAELQDGYVAVKRNVVASCAVTGLDADVRLTQWQGGVRDACLAALTELLSALP